MANRLRKRVNRSRVFWRSGANMKMTVTQRGDPDLLDKKPDYISAITIEVGKRPMYKA